MRDHPFDRLATLIASPDHGLSRRRFLMTSAALAASTVLPLQPAARADAAAVTSCSCQGYGDRVYLDCWDEFVDGAGPFNDSNGVLATLQFGIANAGGNLRCKPMADQAQSQCQQVPCPPGESCVTPHGNAPVCQKPCGGGCDPLQSCCGTTCVTLSSDNENCGKCGKICVAPSKCCNGHCTTGTCETCAEQLKQQLGVNAPPPSVSKWFVSCKLDHYDLDGPGGCYCIQTCSDENNCGGCGIKCGAQGGTTGRCVDGTCVYDTSTYGFCTADPNQEWTSATQNPGTAC
jgi:hypothetical protein